MNIFRVRELSSGTLLLEYDQQNERMSGFTYAHDFSARRLRNSDWIEAQLIDANFAGSDLRHSTFRRAYLERVNFSNTSLIGVNFADAVLKKVDFTGSTLPPPCDLLKAYWGEVSSQLTGDLMLFDSLNHPRPEMFESWAKLEGPCPYDDPIRITRACNFVQDPHCWGLGKMEHMKPWDLLMRLFKEKGIVCEWTQGQQL